MRKIFVYTLWTLLLLGVLAAALAFTAINKGWIGYMPPIEELQNPINRFATQVYSWRVYTSPSARDISGTSRPSSG